MSLVVEDGSGIQNANTYVSEQVLRDYASLRGLALPEGSPEVQALLVRAADWLESRRFLGTRFSTGQALKFPREGIVVDGLALPAAHIPYVLIKAQMVLALQAQAMDLMPSSDGAEVVREKVDVIETEYAEQGNPNRQPIFEEVERLLEPLIGPILQPNLRI